MPFVWYLANGFIGRAFLLFIPFYNLYLWIKGSLHGRQMSWERGDWKSFATYKRRQVLIDRFAVWFVIVVVLLSGGLIGVGIILEAHSPSQTLDNVTDKTARRGGKYQSSSATDSSYESAMRGGWVHKYPISVAEQESLGLPTPFDSRSMNLGIEGEKHVYRDYEHSRPFCSSGTWWVLDDRVKVQCDQIPGTAIYHIVERDGMFFLYDKDGVEYEKIIPK